MHPLLNTLGYYGPVFLPVLIVSLLLYTSTTLVKTLRLLVVVTLWQLGSYIVNVVIKNALAYPRPYPFDHDAQRAARESYWTRHKAFGMPSGHVQAVVGQMLFLAWYVHQQHLPTILSMALTGVAVAQALLTSYQRYTTNRHSWAQIAAGALVGALLFVVVKGFFIV